MSRSIAAASELPPPKPLSAGIRFVNRTAIEGILKRSEASAKARVTVFNGGTAGSEHEKDEGASTSTSKVSNSPIAWKTVRKG